MSSTGFLEVDYEGKTIILTPKTNLGEYHCLQREFEKERIIELLDHPDIKNVVIDFHAMDYLGSICSCRSSSTWGTMVNDRNGRMVLWQRIRPCPGSLPGHEPRQQLADHRLRKEQALQAVGILQMS